MTSRHQHVFVGGLHRSGTSVVTRALAEHPEISGFSGTGVPEDEGQHLQSVVPSGRAYAGAGRFAFQPDAHLTEESPLATAANARRMLGEWSAHWDLACPVLLEKSPPNLIRSRFLQALFPGSLFVMVTRHPIAVAVATHRWSRRRIGVETALVHWIAAHETFAADRPHVHRLVVVRYEEFAADPSAALAPVFAALGLAPWTPRLPVRKDLDAAYFRRWNRDWNPRWRRERRRLVAELEPRVEPFGYSLADPTPGPAPQR